MAAATTNTADAMASAVRAEEQRLKRGYVLLKVEGEPGLDKWQKWYVTVQAAEPYDGHDGHHMEDGADDMGSAHLLVTKNAESVGYRAVLDLRGAGAPVFPDMAKVARPEDHCIEISTPTRTIWMCAADHKTVKNWAAAITSACAGDEWLRSRSQSNVSGGSNAPSTHTESFYRENRGCLGDWDQTFAYQTIKIVRVRDRSLGILRALLMLGIFGYVVFTILYGQKFLATDIPPVGAMRATLNRQASGTDPSQLLKPQCTQSPEPYFDKARCEFWDTLDLMVPGPTHQSLFISTFITTQQQTQTCYPGFCDDSSVHKRIKQDVTYPAGIEEYSLQIRHSFISTGFDQVEPNKWGRSIDEMKGLLVNSKGDTVQKFEGDRSNDGIQLSTLLTAAGVDLQANSASYPVWSERHTGLVILFQIEYGNYKRWGDYTIEYKYTPYIAPATNYTTNDVLILPPKIFNVTVNGTWDGNTTGVVLERLWRKRSGIQIIFIQSGLVQRFDAQTTLVHLTSSLSLLAMSTLVVDMMMLYVMALREKYKRAKIQEVSIQNNASLTGRIQRVGEFGSVDNAAMDSQPEGVDATDAAPMYSPPMELSPIRR